LINEERIKLSIRLIRSAHEAAKSQAAISGSPLSMIVADAATQILLATYRSDREAEILRAVERIFFKLQKLEKRQSLDLLILKEMVGLGIRAYFNHTPEVPEGERSAALLSGKARFHRYLDTLARNLRQNQSILGDVPEQSNIQSDGSDATEIANSESILPKVSDSLLNGKTISNEASPMEDANKRSSGGDEEPRLFQDSADLNRSEAAPSAKKEVIPSDGKTRDS
jgi:hypothetical protein